MRSMGKRIAGAGVLALSLLGLGATAALADDGRGSDDAAEAQALQAATVKLADAIRAAETSTGGTVASIDFEAGQAAGWEVKLLMADGTVRDVMVDAQTGAVTDEPASGGDNDSDSDSEDDGEDDGEDESSN